MKRLSKFFSAALIAVALSATVAAAGTFENTYSHIASTDDTLNVTKKMRVIFIPNSTYRNFKIGIESPQKTDVNIQVLNSKGMVVYSDLQEKVSKKLEEINFSFLKKGEYTVKVSSQDDVYTKTLLVP
ncbi:T9SS type A sorting domain-containing protein [Rhodocytophaga aerolata]|uniref:T9SS type A sorting domain-containing protein n=1 Tax=Rhodocytophaga aerolata TaxID=455078 RepID=A0ABT8RJ06_9BACT|nr:T9SS type A sorting domain-containing protein [Rhodocytophaga aerolata]MDO1451163.1 T9SS type A sorting domain-containing protein [Rhodocytophaga aerolata]